MDDLDVRLVKRLAHKLTGTVEILCPTCTRRVGTIQASELKDYDGSRQMYSAGVCPMCAYDRQFDAF